MQAPDILLGLLSRRTFGSISLPRNPVLATLFRCIKLTENAGFGFDKMQDNWFTYNKTKPEFRGDIYFSVVDFQTRAQKTTMKTTTKTTTKTSTKNEGDLLELIKLNPDPFNFENSYYSYIY